MVTTFYDPIILIGCTLTNRETEKYWYPVVTSKRMLFILYEGYWYYVMLSHNIALYTIYLRDQTAACMLKYRITAKVR